MEMMFYYVITFPKYRVEQIVSAVFAFLYAPVMLSFIYLTRNTEYGIYMVWLIMISSWICDTCAYFVGVTIGKKRIFPVLSPKKSLEGCIGGIAGAAIVGGLYAFLFVRKVIDDVELKIETYMNQVQKNDYKSPSKWLFILNYPLYVDSISKANQALEKFKATSRNV
mgnify:CR=1 FL=1